MHSLRNLFANINQMTQISIPSFSKILDISYNLSGSFSLLIDSDNDYDDKVIFLYISEENFIKNIPPNFKYLKTVEYTDINPVVKKIIYSNNPDGEIFVYYHKYYIFIDYNETIPEKRERLLNTIINN